MQLDRVVVPAGVFNPARTFSVVRDDDGLYLIYTGKAMGPRRGGGVAGVAAGAILDKMADKRSVEIAKVEDQLRQSSAAAMKETRNSRFIPRAAIKAVTIKDQGTFPVVVVEADKKVKLHFEGHDPAAVRELFAPLQPAG